jgi:hypothetical protein
VLKKGRITNSDGFEGKVKIALNFTSWLLSSLLCLNNLQEGFKDSAMKLGIKITCASSKTV